MKKVNMSSSHQLMNRLDKRLLGYSLASGVMIAGGNSHAAVQWSGTYNSSVPVLPLPFPIIFPGAGGVRENLYYFGSLQVFVTGVNGVQNAFSVPYNAISFNPFQTIGQSQNFNIRGSLTYFAGPGPKYIGVKLSVGGNTHYGWIGITFTPGVSLIVHDWAWEQVPNQPILAGSTVSLSVALTSFTATMESDAVILAWTTESEVDNLGFALERCDMDGEGNLLSDWVEIASYLTHPELEGRGNTSEVSEYKITDPNVEVGQFYGYRLIDVDVEGNRQVHNLIQVEVVSTMPEGMVLLQNFPNPFNPATTIEFSIPEQDNVNLSIYNLKGQTVDVLVNEEMSAGPHHVSWDGSDQPAGVYFYELRTGSHREIRKLMLVK
ncbi:T9SS type A sorting domain-containing protein [candidate division KSB1 bacterium]|nr:T9SS type A sorting domain-containing protein [candidate division KSB1 bacterium]